MSDLERLLTILERNGMWEVADVVRAHLKEDMARDTKLDSMMFTWTARHKLLDEVVTKNAAIEGELAARDADMRMNFETAVKALRERDRLEAELAASEANKDSLLTRIEELEAELAALKEHSCKYEKMWAAQVRVLAELREAARTVCDDPFYQSAKIQRLRQLLEEKP